ncbi:hypothetical protein FA95DRAFT_1614085, partial [Auriscalpium vulgare]
MRSYVRNANGTTVDDITYRNICNSARVVKLDLLAILPDNKKNKARSITYYRSFHHHEWREATHKVEGLQPVLALCRLHWKAEQMLANSMKAVKKDDDELAGKNEVSDDTTPPPGNSLPQPPSKSTSNSLSVPHKDDEISKKRKKDSTSTPICPQIKKRARAATISPLRFPSAAPEADIQAPVSDPHPVLQAALFLKDLPSDAGSPKVIDVDFIVVNSSVDNFIPKENFPGINPDADVIAFLGLLETTDPNAADLDADNADAATWGHKQFTGSFTCSDIKLWGQIGNVSTTCRLIAAAVCTCKVARHLCFERKSQATAYLSDDYLEKLIDKIYERWYQAYPEDAHSDKNLTLPTDDERRASWASLTKNDIKSWLEKYNIKLATNPKTKN